MKLFSKTFLFCFFVVLSLDILDGNVLKDSVILDGNIHDGLLSDGSVKATQDNKDIRLSGTGRINLTLDYGELVFEVCPNFNCAEKSTVCFETTENRIETKLQCSGIPSYCTFGVHKEGEQIFFCDAPVHIQDFGGSCLYPKIHTGYVTAVGIINFKSCGPNIVDKMIKLYVDIDPSCPITVKNAKVYIPPTTTAATKVPPTQSPPKDSAEASSFPEWGYAVIGIVLLIVIIIIGFVVYYFYRKRQTSKLVPSNVDRKHPKSTVSKAIVETPVRKDDDLEAVKVEPMQSQTKGKKTKANAPTTTEDIPVAAAKIEPKKIQKPEKKTIQEPSTTEDIPAPTVTQQKPAAPSKQLPAPTVKHPEPAPSKQLPPPNPAARYPLVRRLIPRGMKSAKTDSLSETLKKDKTAMTESLVVSAEKCCLKADESDVLRKMKAAYPNNIQHDVMPSEVNLLCLAVSKMYEEMDSMALESEQKLTSAGCKFDERHCIVSVSAEARDFLKAKTTDATTVYFAFGAQFHEHISDKSELLEKASIPLLYSFALQSRFSEESRRKACARLRRQLVKVLGYYKAADRAKMPFPINIVEDAYCKDPKYFYDPAGIKTDSGSYRKYANW